MTGDRSASDKSAARAERKARLAAALRQNLKRRKAQARGRASDAAPKQAAEKSVPGRRPEGSE